MCVTSLDKKMVHFQTTFITYLMPSKILKHVTTDQDRCNSSLTASKEAFVTILTLQFKFNFEHFDIVVSIGY